MRSLLISSEYFPPQVGGISHMMASIAVAMGPDHVCCLTGAEGDGQDLLDLAGISVHRRRRAFSGRRSLQALHLVRVMAPIWLRERPAAVQISTAYDGYLGPILRRFLGLPYVLYAHGNEVLHAMDPDAWPQPLIALRGADRVIANSRFTAGLLDRAGIEPRRVEIVHPGCDVQHHRPLLPDPELRRRLLGDRTRGAVILTVGNLVARKGHDMVIRALPQVIERQPDAIYLVVGEGPYREALEREADALGVRGHVVFAGRLSADDLPRCYALADVFAMPSRQILEDHDVEGFGIVFIEAGACGKPVVAGRSGGIVDAVVDDETGVLVDPLDVDAVAASLVRLLGDRELAKRMGARARERAVRDFTWARVARDVMSVLEAAVEESSARPPAGSPASRQP